MEEKNLHKEKTYSMTDTELLEKKIDASGLKKGFLADELGISTQWFKRKVENEVPFKAYEIQILCRLLRITDLQEKDRIFFAEDVEKNSTVLQ